MILERNPQKYGLESIGGKDIHHIAWYDVGRGPVTAKQVMDVVADDRTVYRWARFNDDEPWTFQHRVRPDGSKDAAKRKLPQKVEELVARTDDALYS